MNRDKHQKYPRFEYETRNIIEDSPLKTDTGPAVLQFSYGLEIMA